MFVKNGVNISRIFLKQNTIQFLEKYVSVQLRITLSHIQSVVIFLDS